MEASAFQIAVLVFCSILIGFSKTGVPTIGIFVAAILAGVFPARESVGLLLPILIIGDVIAIMYYRKAVVWKLIIALLPWVLVGLIAGFAVLLNITDASLAVLIGTLVLALIGLFLFQGRLEKAFNFSVARSKPVNAGLGFLAGFTTMVGNSAGSVMSIYLLSQGVNKTAFIGTGAYYFFIINLVKVPFLVYLGLINTQSTVLNLWMIPAVAAGAWLGFKVLPLIPQKLFQTIILVFAAIGALYLIFS